VRTRRAKAASGRRGLGERGCGLGERRLRAAGADSGSEGAGAARTPRAAGADAASDCAGAVRDCADAARDCAKAASECADAAREGGEGCERMQPWNGVYYIYYLSMYIIKCVYVLSKQMHIFT
jgi:hypothetical protein